MLPPYEQFEANVGQVRSLLSLTSAIDAQTTGAVDVSDVYRAGLVLGVSALDHYVHEKTLNGMLQVSQGLRPATTHFQRFKVNISALGPAFDAPIASWMESELRAAHSFQTFQRSDAIADAIRLVHPDPLWPTVAFELRMPTEDAKRTLDLIVDRRNKIAHEADCEPTGLGIKWPISEAIVSSAVDFLVAVVGALESLF